MYTTLARMATNAQPPAATVPFKELRNRDRETQKQAVLVAARLAVDSDGTSRDEAHWIASELLRRDLHWTPEELDPLLTAYLRDARKDGSWGGPRGFDAPITELSRWLEGLFDDEPMPAPLRRRVAEVESYLARRNKTEHRKALRRLQALLDTDDDHDGRDLPLPRSTDQWTTAAKLVDLPAADPILRLGATASGTKPTKEFTNRRAHLLEEHGVEPVGEAAGAMLDAAANAVAPAKADSQIPPHAGDLLRGIAWIAAATDTEPAARGAGAMATAGWKKVPGFGPLSRKAASAAVQALAAMPRHGAQHLGRVRALLKQPTAVAEVDKAIDEASERLGIPRAEFEERVVPHFGLDPDSGASEPLGDHTAELTLDPQLKATLSFVTKDGKRRKGVPQAVKDDHAGELTALKQRAKDITTMAQAQRLRLERLLLDETRTWTAETWRERYLDHGLVAPLARRLIWTAGDTPVIHHGGTLRNHEGKTHAPQADDPVTLWHPVDAAADDVMAWRRFLEEHEITQPFKQAHREVYLLTDAERETTVYSNRFAAHVLRQHQFAALARTRGWRYQLQGAFDTPDEHAELALPAHDLQATFWVERPWDAPDEDVNDAGIFTHVLTDQVRFHAAANAARVALDDVPKRAFSEAMRDVDLFVGVASIGNDPAWQDGGENRQWDRYWGAYSFGELSAQAEVRRDVLERLLPKLKIRDVAQIRGRFLVVEGRRRTYKIHLGSGNILMEPNDQYLCIVPGRGRDTANVFLPFEGDRTLSVILSKAMMLAGDDEITDPTIVGQITSS